ncbi:hypothetical protein ACHAXM_001613 [Skeletonema potamos]|jgi:hypothetical protein
MSTTKKRKTDTIDIVLDDEHVVTTMIPTKLAAPNDEDPKRVVDVSDLSEEDLKTLKKQDPFLYYSIPRALRNSAVDLTNLSSQNFAQIRRASCPSPSLIKLSSSSSSTNIVQRKSCISFEVHADLLLEEYMEQATPPVGNGAGFDFDTMLDQLLLRNSNKRQQ